MDRMIRQSLFATPLLLIMLLLILLPVVCQAEPLSEHFIVELEHNAVFLNQNFFILPDRHTLPGKPSDTGNANGYSEMDSLHDDQAVYREKTNLIGSISWQWLYTTHLLVGYEQILTTKDAPLSANSFSWLPAEVVLAVGWLLKSYIKKKSMSYIMICQQEATSILTLGDEPFACITMVLGSGRNQQSHSLSESTGEQVSGAMPQLTGIFTSLVHTDSGSGNRGPQQPQHTLDLNCFVSPCHGVCNFRPSSYSRESAECPLNAGECSTGNSPLSMSAKAACTNDSAGPINNDVTSRLNLPATSDEWIIIDGLLNLRGHHRPEETTIACMPTHLTRPMEILPSDCLPSAEATHCHGALSNHKKRDHIEQQSCDVTVVGENGQRQPCRKVCRNARALSVHKSSYHTGQKTCGLTVVREDGQLQPCGMVLKNARFLAEHKRKVHSGQKNCDLTVFTKDGQQRSCGRICKNSYDLLSHKKREHTGQQTCQITVVGKDGQQRPCGKVSGNALALSVHKSSYHTGQKTCHVTMTGEDGKQRPCGTVYKNARFLADHKRKAHSGQQTCNVTVVTEDGQRRPCGIICKSTQALSGHKSRDHTGQQACDVTVVGEDGQPRPCGILCKNVTTLSSHKSGQHSGQKTCDATVIGEDGQPQPCGKICTNAQALSNHKRSNHSKQQTCSRTLVGDDGLQRSCGKIFKNTKALSAHKRCHRKRKPVDVNQNNDRSPKKGKSNN
ncbi:MULTISPECIES: hypothetical protein [unclassified Endozoicomonas]|uniref:hypothetical protein n=1 Tax=unclassified Endozoicomonas TaxID=2644528 RepID=UPI00214969A6|nr:MULTISPECIES: hypothetical protein [unclassified Endozoicomonas]